MVVPTVLAFDIVSVTVSTLVPGLAWASLFLLAWLRPEFARSVGLGRREFWLLLPGALAASFAALPIAPIGANVVALSVAGAIFPLLVATLALGKVAPPRGRSLGRLFLALGVETAALLAAVLVLGSSGGPPLGLAPGFGVDLVIGVAGAALAVGLAFALFPGGTSPGSLGRGVFLATSLVLLLTFLATSAVPGVGIVEQFPYFLVPPLVAGLGLGLLAGRLAPGREGAVLPLAFFAGGWGPTLGADVLRQPGLYGSGPAGLYVIGGAGVLDLVYLSGFLALGVAFLLHVALGRPWTPAGPPEEPALPNPLSRLEEAYDRGTRGDLPGALRASSEASRAAAEEARRLSVGQATEGGRRPWDGLNVPGWVVSDQANLDESARLGTADPREAWRGWLTARWLVRLGSQLARPRFASVGSRVGAFLVDLALLGAASGAVFGAIALGTSGSLDGLLSSVGYNAAIYGAITAAFLYFAIAERLTGTTLGKRLFGLEVRDRRYRRPEGLSALVRNVSLLPTITLALVGLGVVLALLLRGFGSASVSGVGVPAGAVALAGVATFVGGGIALLGVLGILAIGLTFERQRVGDLWAGTWVVRRLSAGPAGPPPATAVRSE